MFQVPLPLMPLIALGVVACATTPTPTPPPAPTAVPPATLSQPTTAPVPTAASVPPTATSVPPTATRIPSTATSTPLTSLDGVYDREIAVSSGKRFDFLRFFADGNVALNGAVAADAQAAWNSVRASLTPGNPNIATGRYRLKGKEIAFTLKVVNDVWAEVTGTIEGNTLTLNAKISLPRPSNESRTYTRADFTR